MKQFFGSFFFQITAFISCYAFFTDGMVTIIFIFILSYYQHIRIRQINKTIENIYNEPSSNSSTQISLSVKKFSEEHNRFCSQIFQYNNYWKELNLLFLATAFPINLSATHQIMFENLDIEIRSLYLINILVHNTVLFGLTLSYASFSQKIHKMCSNLSRLQWRISSNPFCLRTKFKLLMCFERLSSRKKIGVSFGGTVMTFPLFSKVNNNMS